MAKKSEKYHRRTNENIDTLLNSVPVGENDSDSHDFGLPDSDSHDFGLPDSCSLDFGSYDPMYYLIGQAGYLQQIARFKVSRVLIEADGDVWTITLLGAGKDGIPVELQMSQQKNPLPFRSTMQNKQGTSRANS